MVLCSPRLNRSKIAGLIYLLELFAAQALLSLNEQKVLNSPVPDPDAQVRPFLSSKENLFSVGSPLFSEGKVFIATILSASGGASNVSIYRSFSTQALGVYKPLHVHFPTRFQEITDIICGYNHVPTSEFLSRSKRGGFCSGGSDLEAEQDDNICTERANSVRFFFLE